MMENWMKLLNRFGYMVVGSPNKRKIGQILPQIIGDEGIIEHPWVVREETTSEDFNIQREFLGHPTNIFYDYYYRVTTD